MNTKNSKYLINFIIILFVISFFSKYYITNEDFYASKYTSLILKKYNYRGALNISYKIIDHNNLETVAVTEKLYYLSEIGDTLVKKENSNECILIKKDTTYYLKFTD